MAMQYECMACGFKTTMDVMLTAHQAVCAKIEQEKREYREAVLVLFGCPVDDIPKVLELARSASREQNKAVV